MVVTSYEKVCVQHLAPSAVEAIPSNLAGGLGVLF